ncbi:hypothetical protein [Ancylobacter sp.]|uniref:hypothetical protein n=1 Tax=Ancylobacter sp. TaxID=1872567 RepID=UPI003C79B489
MTLHLPARLRQRLLRAALAVMARRPADMLIGGAERPYMRRWWLFPRNRWFNIYLHDFQRDDDDRALHDHPWPSLSILLQGDLIETYAPIPALAAEPAHQRTRHLTPGAIVWRGPRFAHRLALTWSPRAMAPRPAITLFIVGPRVREWGFWCPKGSPAGGWIPWKRFVSPDDPGAVGPGCE